jgi:hypothetical protein
MAAVTTNGPSGAAPARGIKRWELWTGRLISAVPVVMMVFSALLKLTRAPAFVVAWTDDLGFPASALTPIAVVELLCVLFYVVPRTGVLGAILVTAFLGGATTAHVRVGAPFIVPIVLGIAAWAGLYLRDGRLRALLPLRMLGGPITARGEARSSDRR